MKNIYALYGRGEIGKTSTIKEVYKLLIKKFGNKIIVETDTNIFYEKGDIRVTVKINGKLIGIESQGDPDSRLKTSLNIFVEMNCDIILCATRTRGTTVDFVKLLEPEYKIDWIKKPDFGNEDEQKNKELAEDIFNKIVAEL
ncbi:hypothetical protein OK344_02945 [Kaistella sp. BT6-1-3]|uniref:Uncharacterized protein n=1 Tax=Kaistella yananensis TaxID=2989820 RepID=A0ABT3JK45_9FLAO|nr:hypothetical protein [Kaistella yananensis]MCW4451159.1 hypothetical protein [Kaistella yananensis]